MVADTSSWLFQAKFWVLIICSIPSAICSLLILIYFLQRRRTLAVDHHIIIVLISGSLIQMTTDVPFVIDYYQHGIVRLGSYSFCTWWNWWEYSSNGILLYGMAWASVERHFLVFNRAIVSTKRKRILFHYLPMLIACLFSAVFYFFAMVINSCRHQWDYDTVLCLLPCYVTTQPAVAMLDFVINNAFPVLVIAIANIYLIFRVVLQKRRYNASWQRQRKLTLQLLCIAVLYIIFWFPLTLNGLIMIFVSSSVLHDIQIHYFFFLIYMVAILMPFISLNFLAEFKQTILKRLSTTVGPNAINVRGGRTFMP